MALLFLLSETWMIGEQQEEVQGYAAELAATRHTAEQER